MILADPYRASPTFVFNMGISYGDMRGANLYLDAGIWKPMQRLFFGWL